MTAGSNNLIVIVNSIISGSAAPYSIISVNLSRRYSSIVSKSAAV